MVGDIEMYLKNFVSVILHDFSHILKGLDREIGLKIPRIIACDEKKSIIFVYFKMMYSLLITGCTFKEYYNLNFINRTIRNQKTFITTGSNLQAYKKLNNPMYNHIFINKDEFNNVYSKYIGREWIKLDADIEKIYEFFSRHEDIIVKPKDGDSGIGIFIIHKCRKLSRNQIDEIVMKNKNCLAEEVLYNHSEINQLNKDSLNTMRIITIRGENIIHILFAGIRYGEEGCEIDNISQGGYIAPIDIENGKIFSNSHTKKNVHDDATNKRNFIGFQIPMWDELLPYLWNLTSVVPQMRYMAWDIAITKDGFATIEGNHSSGNTIIQAHLQEKQAGLKPLLEKYAKEVFEEERINQLRKLTNG